MFKVNSIVKFISLLDELDNKVKVFSFQKLFGEIFDFFQVYNLSSIQVDFKTHRKNANFIMLIILLMYSFVAFLIPIVILAYKIDGIITPIVSTSYNFVLFLLTLYTMQFVLAGMALNERFKMLNEYLRWDDSLSR